MGNRGINSLAGAACFLSLPLLVLLPLAATADTFQLRSGGRVEGTWLNPSADSAVVDIDTGNGIRLRLVRPDVEEVARSSTALSRYEQVAPRTRDTIEDHWQLSEYCRQNNLRDHRERHLQRILQLDRNHAGARRGLNYRFVRGNWVTEQQYRRQVGYSRDDGKWQTSQESLLNKERAERKVAERRWQAQIESWLEELVEKRSLEAANRIRGIRDPIAVGPLASRLTTDRFRAVKQLYIDALGEINTAESRRALVFATLNDPDIEIFHDSLNRLVRKKHPDTTAAYIEALKSEHNEQVNRAAVALRKIGDASAVAPLIESLITTHTTVIGNPSSGGDAISTTFSSQIGANGSPIGNPSSQLSTGKSAELIEQQFRNEEVLHTLTVLTRGVTFGYNLDAWHRWYAIEARRGTQFNARRD